MKAFLAGRRLVAVLVFFVGLALWAYSSVNDALNYTEVEATVDRGAVPAASGGSVGPWMSAICLRPMASNIRAR